ncbi:SOS response-associated peptidase [Variovorax sp. PMC12]|uniref:SOS response-associated peptidase n=1 Tax=Variovorax sp. PMC12 TaxID=2126319 RepID=UPI00131A7A1C|nr:SOS response-associated peptidase family protein [Variovorax sp. PMC12]
MCSNYEAVTRADRLLSFFGVVREGDEKPVIAWPTGMAPFIRLAEDGSGNRRVDDGAFGLVPAFAKELAYGRRTYNAKSETVSKLPSFRNAWRRGQRCIVPAEGIFEPYYETADAKPVRWRIQQPGEVPFAIAGIWEKWVDTETGEDVFSFAMLTVNADGHPVMSRFHKWGEEKRMVIILDHDQQDEWLTCPVQQAPKFFRRWMGQMETFPAPLPPRAKKATTPSPPLAVEPPDGPEKPELF